MFIKSAEYLDTGENIKAVIQTAKKCFAVSLILNGETIDDYFNVEEPFDLKTHIFYVPVYKLQSVQKLTLRVRRHKKFGRMKEYSFDYKPEFAKEQALKKAYDNHITRKVAESEIISDGVIYTRFLGQDKDKAPVNAFVLEIDTTKASLYIGTPDDGYKSTGVQAKVPEMIDSAVKNKVPVVAAVNADFFDMLGDCHPSGLCIKNSRVIANPESLRPFIGIKKDGTPVITDITESPEIISKLSQAAAGLEMIVKDGEIFDFGPLEPFGYVRHPRTAAGIRNDGTVILLVVDGRIPEYSNGASLVDLAQMMINLGADRALNLDGGGSSIIYTKKDNGFMLRNTPADLFRPRAKLIRKEFDALLVVPCK